MTTLSPGVLTQLDVANRQDPDGMIAEVAELLDEQNDIWKDPVWLPSNQPTSHRGVIRTSLPPSYLKRLGEGVPSGKSTTAPIEDVISIFEQWSVLEYDQAKLSGDVDGLRVSEAKPQWESMVQNFLSVLIYGSRSDNELEFDGVMVRYDDLAGIVKRNTLDAGGDNTATHLASMLLINWGAESVHLIYPEEVPAGIDHMDLGLVDHQEGTDLGSSNMLAYKSRWQLQAGLHVRDWRCLVRICNIDMDLLVEEDLAAADLIKLMIRATHRCKLKGLGRLAFYAPLEIHEMLHIQALEKATYQITVDDVGGKPVVKFLGIPVRTVEQLTYQETLVA